MHTIYADTLDRIDEPPKWFNEHAVPRYCDFAPREVAYIYALEAVLVLIRCQNCQTEFRVAFSEMNTQDRLWKAEKKKVKLIADLIKDRELSYADPPNINCCDAGPSMTSVTVRVLEYWYKPIVRGEGLEPHPSIPGHSVLRDPRALEFVRDRELEIDICPGSWR